MVYLLSVANVPAIEQSTDRMTGAAGATGATKEQPSQHHAEQAGNTSSTPTETKDFRIEKHESLFSSNEPEPEMLIKKNQAVEERRPPTESERKTLRHVHGSIPWIAFILCFVEFAERASYYGATQVFNNFLQYPLPPGKVSNDIRHV
jgi:hypothetical protein